MCSDLVPRSRVLLIGQGPTSSSALAGLLEVHDVVGLMRAAQPGDEAVSRARAAHVPVHDRMRIDDVADLVRQLQPDCVVVSSFNRILPAGLLEACPFVNVHYSQLPRGRGRANVNWAVINGDTHAAISVHELVPDLDAGGLLYQERVPIGSRTTTTQLWAALNAVQQRELGGAVTRMLAGDHGEPQDESQATYGCTRVPADGELVWHRKTDELDRLVRALSAPTPAAFTFYGLQTVWVDVAEPSPDTKVYSGRVPGRIVRISARGGWVDVLTGDGVLRLHRLRLEGGAQIDAAELLSSVTATLGLRPMDLLAELAHLRRLLAAQCPPE